MRIAAGLSTAPSAFDAGVEAVREARRELGGGQVDLAFLFLSTPHLAAAGEAAAAVLDELAPAHLVGCVAQGVVARDREVEEGPAVAVWAASLPGAAIECFHAQAELADDGVVVSGFPALDSPALVALIADPFTFPANELLAELNEAHPSLPLVGGLAIGGGAPGSQALILDGEVYDGGAVGAVLAGVEVEAVVSQGCAPIGREAVITSAEGNIVYELAGRPALERLRDEIETLAPAERAAAAAGLLAGLVIDENRPAYEPGDFLMRGLVGADEETGALAIGESVRVGQTLRFHVRDAASADRDLRERLERSLPRGRPAGALLFTCNGRGRHMFPEPDHDARVLAEALGGTGLAGFFCGGEIGPVGGRSFLHGFTATMAVFLR